MIDNLLYTTDIEVLEQVMRISLRLAQRSSDQRNGRMHFPLSQERLWELAGSLCQSEIDNSISMESMTMPLPSSLIQGKDLQFSYFRTLNDSAHTESTHSGISILDHEDQISNDETIVVSPRFITTQEQKMREGPVVIKIPREALLDSPLEDLLTKVLVETNLPNRYHFRLMLRARLLKALGDVESLSKLVRIRILALASVAYVVSEPVLQAKLACLESNLVAQLAHLAIPEHNSCDSVVAASTWALEAIAHHRQRLGEVLNLLGASISHGTLMYALRKTLIVVCRSSDGFHTETLDAQMSLLHYLSTTNIAGTMLCSAGLIQLLLYFVQECPRAALRVLVKAISLLDHLVYGFPQAFQIFCNASGVSTVVNRIAHEVEIDLERSSDFLALKQADNTDYAMTHENFSVLKTTLKFIVHMMQTPGTGDGLRSLIESSLLPSMKSIYANVDVFGASVFASTSNIMAAFIHNEPSSYQVLDEANIPQTFFSAISEELLPAADALTSLPNVFGAICLNTHGLALFNSHNPIPAFMKIFTSQKHCEILRESDLAGILGSSMDELVRHQPTLCDTVIREIIRTLRDIHKMDHTPSSTLPNACIALFADFDKDGHEAYVKAHATYIDEDQIERPVTLLYVDVVCRFLEGFLQNLTLSRQFCAQEGILQLLYFCSMECIPWDFPKTHANLSLSHLLHLLCETEAQILLDGILQRIQDNLKELQDFVSYEADRCIFQPYIHNTKADPAETELVPRLGSIQVLVTLLKDLYTLHIGAQTRSAALLCSIFASNPDHVEVLRRLAKLQRVLYREEAKISEDLLSPEWAYASEPRFDDAKTQDSVSEKSGLTSEVLESSALKNVKMIRSLLVTVATNYTQFLHGLTKMLSGNRRGTDSIQKLNAIKLATVISKILEDHLSSNSETYLSDNCRRRYLLRILQTVQQIFYDGEADDILIAEADIVVDRKPLELMTCLLLDFQHGVQLLSNHLTILTQQLSVISIDLSEHEKLRETSCQARIAEAAEIILLLLSKMTSEQHFLQSPQTAFLDGRDRQKEQRGYNFEPKAFLSSLRSMILPSLLRIWLESDFINVPFTIARLEISVITQCCYKFSYDSSSRLPELLKDDTSQPSAHAGDDLPDSLQAAGVELKPDIRPGERQAVQLEIYSKISTSLASQAVGLLSVYGSDLVFEIVDLIVKLIAMDLEPKTWVHDVLDLFIASLQSLVEDRGSDRKRQQFRAIAHILVILFFNDDFVKLCQAEIVLTLDTLLDLGEICSKECDEADVNMACTNVLLACDAILSILDYQEVLAENSTSLETLDLSSSVTNYSALQLQRLFDLCMKLLGKKHIDSALTSILRVLVRLSRNQEVIQSIYRRNLHDEIIGAIKANVTECDEDMKVTFLLIMRHLTESVPVLHQTFHDCITQRWDQDKPRKVDLELYAKQTLDLAIRHMPLYLATSDSLCELSQVGFSNLSPLIGFKSLADRGESRLLQPILQRFVAEQQVAESDPAKLPKSPVATILWELRRAKDEFIADLKQLARLASDPLAVELNVLEDSAQPTSELRTPRPNKKLDFVFSPKDNRAYLYMCFLMQSLVELLASYRECKQDFISSVSAYAVAPTSEKQIHSKTTHPTSLRWFLVEIIALFSPRIDGNHKVVNIHKKLLVIVATWARAVIVALCCETSSALEEDTSVTHALVLDCLHDELRAALSSNESNDLRYARMVSYAELLLRLIGNLTDETSSHVMLSTQMQEKMAKMMLEKNFIGLLAQVLAGIDYQHPAMRDVVNSITKAIKILTKLGLRLSNVSSPLSATQLRTGENDNRADFENTETDVQMDRREETPDLYRHSALGLFDAEMHESDEDSYGSDEDEEM